MSFGPLGGMPMLQMKRGEASGGRCGRHIWQQANDAYCRQRRGLNLRQLGETRFGTLRALDDDETGLRGHVRLGRIHWALRSCREKAATGVEVVNAGANHLSSDEPQMKHAAKWVTPSKCGVIAVSPFLSLTRLSYLPSPNYGCGGAIPRDLPNMLKVYLRRYPNFIDF